MSANRNFTVKNGLEVAENLIFADGSKQQVGIKTANPFYTVDVYGDIALTGKLFTPPENVGIGTTTGIIDGDFGNFILGVTPSFFRVNDIVSGSFLQPDTRVVSVGASTIGINPPHLRITGGGVTETLNVTRRVTCGENGQILVSRGAGLNPIWKDSVNEVIVKETTSSNTNYLTFVDGSGEQVLNISPNQIVFIPATGNLGLGITDPNFIFDVLGDTRFDGTLFASLLDGDLVSGNSTIQNLFVIEDSFFDSNVILSSGNIGIGSTLPNARLDISGNAIISGIVTAQQFSGTATTSINSTIKNSNTSLISYPTFVTGTGSTILDINATKLTFIASTASLGIGTDNPTKSLDVIGDISFTNRLFAQSKPELVKTAQGLLSSNNPNFIGINTSNVTVNQIIQGSVGISSNTRVTAIRTTGIDISPSHNVLVSGPIESTISFFVSPGLTPGLNNQILISRGSDNSAIWINAADVTNTVVIDSNENKTFFPILSPVTSGISTLTVDSTGLVYNPSTNRLGIGTSNPSDALDVRGNVTALSYFGDGVNLSGIVTQIASGIGISISPISGKGLVTIESYTPTGKTIYVNQNGNDNNTGLSENHAKRTIKAAANTAIFGDTIKVFPGVYVEENPIVLKKTVSVEGTELRNCVVTPKYPYLDLFHVNNGCHITDLSFIGPAMTDGASIVALQPLEGVSLDRYFDAARLIRTNLDYIANETVGFLTSGFSGFAGNHREQDAARLIDLNINYIAAEAVGFLTSPTGLNFTVPGPGTPGDCADDIKDIFRSVSYDLKANSNKKSVGAALSYFNSSGALVHITGVGVSQATINTLNYAVGIAKSVINNVTPPISYQIGIGSVTQVIDPSVIAVYGGCVAVGTTISQLVGIITSAIGAGNTSDLPAIRYGVTLESKDCADDIKDIWKCVTHDITRGGNSRCIDAGKAYYTDNWNLIPQILKNPGEVQQTVASVDYSFGVARAVINNVTWGGYPAGLTTSVSNATYNAVTGITTITATNHDLVKDDAVKIVGLAFTCPSGPGIVTYPSGAFGYIFNVLRRVDSNNFEVVVGQSTLPHTYVSGGTVQKYGSFPHDTYQVKDLAIQGDPLTGFNNAINGCANVTSAIRSCVGIVTNIVGVGSEAFSTVGIKTTYPGNSGVGVSSIRSITSATYDQVTGKTTIIAPGFSVLEGDQIELRDLKFSCNSDGGISTQRFPSGRYGYDFFVDKVNLDGSFDVYVGPSTLPHTYDGGGLVVDRSVAVSTAFYDNTTGITTITAPGAYVRQGDFVTLRDLQFSCPSGPTILTYPSGKNGFDFKVTQVIGAGTTFVVNVGVSTLPHSYVSGGRVFPPFSRGVGPITQGPYVRNCTNFIPNSIGMKVDGFAAEPGDKDDIGVTGTMSVDSYTQYNQGGIGVSITNGAYSQLVSIFTICDDIAIFTGSGGQCDITNSNSSFGRLGLVSDGVGDVSTGSIYRYTGIANAALAEQPIVRVSSIGSLRPYDGQALYFGELYYEVRRVNISNGGSGYTLPPRVTIDSPTGPNGIRAEAVATIDGSGKVSSIDIISTGSQYRISDSPTVAIDPPSDPGTTATASLEFYPLYYTIESATLPNSGISTITLNTNLNNSVSLGTTVYFSRLSLQIVSSHSFEWVGSGNDINKAKPALGGVVNQENEVVKLNGGEVFYTSTDQAGNFRIGDDFVINQLTGTVTGRSFNQSILNNVTPLIIALGR
jgi:hypothetical protein